MRSCPAAGAASSTIRLADGEQREGTFQAFKNDRFYFQPRDEKTLRAMRLRVESLTLAPPAKVSVKPRGKKKITDLKLCVDPNQPAEALQWKSIKSFDPGND